MVSANVFPRTGLTMVLSDLVIKLSGKAHGKTDRRKSRHA